MHRPAVGSFATYDFESSRIQQCVPFTGLFSDIEMRGWDAYARGHMKCAVTRTTGVAIECCRRDMGGAKCRQKGWPGLCVLNLDL